MKRTEPKILGDILREFFERPFVARKLAPIEGVVSTSTHFVLKKYKDDGMIFYNDEEDSRQVITL